MKLIIFGSTGMIGQAVIKEALLASNVEAITLVNRSPAQIKHAKITEFLVTDLFDLSSLKDHLGDYDACIFCIGVSAAFMDEHAYTKLTYDLTMSVAHTLFRANPGLVFVYITGQGTDSTESGARMWARVKGKTENALLKLPFKAAYMFRPGAILPLDGIRSKTKLYDMLYLALTPLVQLVRLINPAWIPTTRDIGRAMLAAAEGKSAKLILNNQDIVELAASHKVQGQKIIPEKD